MQPKTIYLFTALKSSLLVLCLCNVVLCGAQTSTDTLNLAMQLRDKQQIDAAITLLKNYYGTHPNDLNTTWLYAQTAFLKYDYTTTEQLYNKAINNHPTNFYLKFDYARKAFAMGKLSIAENLFTTYLTYDSTQAECLNALATMAYWKGHYKTAIHLSEKCLKYNTGNTAAQQQLVASKLASAVWVNMAIMYNNDSQPLQTLVNNISFGKGISTKVNPYASIYLPVFLHHGSAFGITLGNKTAFKASTLQLGVGFISLPSGNGIPTAEIGYSKALTKHITLEALAEKKAYLYLLASLDTVVNTNHLMVGASLTSKQHWLAKAMAEVNIFNDNHSVYSTSLWALAPIIYGNIAKVHMGYGYQYSNASGNNFTAPKNLPSNLVLNQPIEGAFSPYFTPKTMQVHNAILALQLNTSAKTTIGINGSYGIYSSLQNPYLYVTTLPTTSTTTTITKDFSVETFSPAEFTISSSWHPTAFTSLTAGYQYKNTFFYTLHQATINLKIHFK